mmetsp:Transcript_2930/g.8254  ORF Transcript_2930/g.8254 Transcript_2930/m.8254 type:complete len:379 (+) Transcript_2930:926-2062(+)
MREVWFLALTWANVNVKAPGKHGVSGPEELKVWNQARNALRMAKTAAKKKLQRQKVKVSNVGLVATEDIEGHLEDPEFVAANELEPPQVGTSSPGANEIARMLAAMSDETTDEALDQLIRGYRDREVLDDKVHRLLPFVEFAKAYNNKSFLPVNPFVGDPEVCSRLRLIQPSKLERVVTEDQLKGWWTTSKANVNLLHSRWSSSGRMSSGDMAPKENFCRTDMATLYMWEFTYRNSKLWSFTNKSLPSDARKESLCQTGNDPPSDDHRGGPKPELTGSASSRPHDSFLSAAQNYLERSLPPTLDPHIAKQKQAAELHHLQVQMLNQKVETLLKVLASPGLDPTFKSTLQMQMQQLIHQQMSLGCPSSLPTAPLDSDPV